MADMDPDVSIESKDEAFSNEDVSRPQTSSHQIKFLGDSKDYTKIWLVNLLLSVLTLGIYSPWAKVRARRYMYGNTIIDGHHFDFTADPKVILRGRIFMALLMASLYIGAYFHPAVIMLGFLVLMIISPWAIVKSMSFNLKHTTHRGLSFGFKGQTPELFGIYLKGLLLQVTTLGFYIPIFILNIISFKFENTHFGNEQLKFERRPGFYGIYLKAGLMYFGFFILLIVLVVASIKEGTNGAPPEEPIWIQMFTYLLIALVTAYIKGNTFNYVIGSLSSSGLSFSSTLKVSELVKMYVTNLFAIVFTLGLATPWAMLRLYRYKAESITVHVNDPMLFERLEQARQEEGSAVGDAAADFMDLEVGI